ncbi:MAG: metallophosphoesterase [Verrucomicrobiota bacterium]|jgi:Icc-related predicted phosphoesterase
MRLHVLCDLHLEFGPVRIPPADADVVVLAGDIDLDRGGCQWAQSHFPVKPVIYVLGNHEFYRHSLPALTEDLKRETENSHIHVLENDAVEIGGYTFLGCTLWTDFQLSGDAEAAMRVAEGLMNDYRVIQFNPKNRALRASDTVRLHTESVAWMRKALAKCNPARTIVVTHHAPSARAEAPYHADSPLKPAFSSNLDNLIEKSGVPLWIFGHTHYNVEYTIGSTRVLTNQRGYPSEGCRGFDPGLVIEV